MGKQKLGPSVFYHLLYLYSHRLDSLKLEFFDQKNLMLTKLNNGINSNFFL